MYAKYCLNKVDKKMSSIKIQSDKSLIPKISSYFLNMLHSNGVEQCDALQIAFEEALTNAIVHGNKNRVPANIMSEEERKKIISLYKKSNVSIRKFCKFYNSRSYSCIYNLLKSEGLLKTTK